jgi:uncharacterized protein YdcH (DUF465 family)
MDFNTFPNIRNDGRVYVNLESRHLLFLMNTKFDLDGFIKEALDNEIAYYEWATKNTKQARELEVLRKEKRSTRWDIIESIKNVAKLYNKYEELDEQISDLVECNCTLPCNKNERSRYKMEPINRPDGKNVFHHMYLNVNGKVNQNVGVYIPVELHTSIRHNSKSGKNMKEINKASLIWLCEQSEI